MNNYKNLKNLVLGLFTLTILAACSDEDQLDDVTPAFNIQLENNSSFGSILVNQNNQTLYFFAGDVTGESNCNGGCAEAWPPVIADAADLNLTSNLNSSYFGNVSTADGQKQLTYKGWPLYYFSPESDGVLEAPGAVEGDARGNVFYVAKPDYSLFLGRQVVTEGEDAEIYLVDANGNSFYFFANDEENVSNCAGGCLSAWPVFENESDLVLPSAFSVNQFGKITRADEKVQVTYAGKPLYFFAQDTNRGDIKGHTAPNWSLSLVQF